jgi:hypothetical protein
LTIAVVLAAALAVVCVILVALPFLREPDPETDELDELDEGERRRLELLDSRDRALSALKELEFDHRTGTITDDDYRNQVGPLRREAAMALQALQRNTLGTHGDASTGEGRPVGRRT